MRQTFRYVEQVSGDENPIRVKVRRRLDDTIMPRTISVEVQIREMNGATTGKGAVHEDVLRNLMNGKTELALRDETERSIERLAQAIPDKRSCPIRPGRSPSPAHAATCRVPDCFGMEEKSIPWGLFPTRFDGIFPHTAVIPVQENL